MYTSVRGITAARAGRWLRIGLAVLVACLTGGPFLWMTARAVESGAALGVGAFLPADVTFQNFVHVMTNFPFPRYMWNSLVKATSVTLVALLFHSMAAYALARLRFPGRDVVFMAIFTTLLVGLPVIIVPLFLVVRELGMINTYPGLIVPAIFNAFGIFLLRQFYMGIPRELEEAAAVDGAGYWRTYWHVILPLSRPIFAALAVFFFLANWNSFLWPLTVATDQRLWVIQVGIATFQSQYGAAWNYIMAASTISALPTILLFFLLQRRIVESIKVSGFR